MRYRQRYWNSIDRTRSAPPPASTGRSASGTPEADTPRTCTGPFDVAAATAVRWRNSHRELLVAVGRDDGTVTVHDLRRDDNSDGNNHNAASSSAAVAVLADHVSAVTGIDWNDDGTWFVTAGRDAVLNLWSVVTTTAEKEETSGGGHVGKGGSSSSGKKKSKKRKKTLSSTSSSKVLVRYQKVHTMPVYEQVEGLIVLSSSMSLSLSPGSRGVISSPIVTVVTAGSKGRVRVWEAAATSSSAAAAQDRRSSSSKVAFRLLTEQTEEEAFGEDKGGYLDLRHCLSYDDDDDDDAAAAAAAAGSEKKRHEQQQLVVADAEHNLTFLSLSLLVSNRRKGGKDDRRVLVSSPAAQLTTQRTWPGHNNDILDIKVIPAAAAAGAAAAAPTTTTIAVATNSSQLSLFDLETWNCTVLPDLHTAAILCVDCSPCGRYIATCGKDKTMRLWRRRVVVTTSTSSAEEEEAEEASSSSNHHHSSSRYCCVAVAAGHTEAVGSVALSNRVSRYQVTGKAAVRGAGAFCVTAGADRTIKRWNLPNDRDDDDDNEMSNGSEMSLQAAASARAHDRDINIVTIAPNDSLVATGSQDKSVKLWNATDLSLRATLTGHKRGVWDCQFSAVDRVLATASADRTIKLWSIAGAGAGACVRTFQGHAGGVLRVRFLSAGLQLLSSGADGLVKLWTIRTNECVATMDGHRDRVWALDVLPPQPQQTSYCNTNNNEEHDDRTLSSSSSSSSSCFVSGGADSRIVVWQDTTKQVQEEKDAKAEEALLADQQLANHLRHGEHSKALDIALRRDKPQQALKVVSAIVQAAMQQGGSTTSTTTTKNGQHNHTERVREAILQKHVRDWSTESGGDFDDRLVRVLRYCREWNTRARNSHTAMLLVRAVVSTVPAHRLAAIDGVPEILAGIIPYAERHFDRLDRLHSGSYLFDFALSVMGNLQDDDDESHSPAAAASEGGGGGGGDRGGCSVGLSSSERALSIWESSSKLVLPPKRVDGRVQVGGSVTAFGRQWPRDPKQEEDDDDQDEEDDVVTIGESDDDD